MGKLSLKLQMGLLVFFALTLLSLAIVYSATKEARELLIQKNYEKLTVARDMKRFFLEKYFSDREADIASLIQLDELHTIMHDLLYVYRRSEIDPKGPYPTDHQSLKLKQKRHDQFLQAYQKDYGHKDIYIIDAQFGHVMYTARKKSDFGENLTHGKYASSALAKAWKSALESEKPIYIDMSSYEPNDNLPTLFLASRVTYGEEIIGVIVFAINNDQISSIMNYRAGYGESHEDYLVGNDYLMRSDSYLDPEAHSLIASFANPASGKVETKAAKQALAGVTNTEVVMDYRGIPVLSSYAPIQIGSTLKWAIMSEIDEAEVLVEPNSIRNSIIITSLILLIIFITFALYLLHNLLSRPLEKLKKTIVHVSNTQDLTTKLMLEKPQELFVISQSFNELIANLQSLLHSAKSVSNENASVSQELSSTSSSVGKNVEKALHIVSQASQKPKPYAQMYKTQ